MNLDPAVVAHLDQLEAHCRDLLDDAQVSLSDRDERIAIAVVCGAFMFGTLPSDEVTNLADVWMRLTRDSMP